MNTGEPTTGVAVQQKDYTRASKFLSFVLRHQPEAARITLDAAGWADVEELLAGCARARHSLTLSQLDHIVATNEKKRFECSEDGKRIRASQGDPVEVELQYEPQEPPELLYHGTATRFLDSIRTNGLLKMQRHHVHLSAEMAATLKVGARHGKPALLTIRRRHARRRLDLLPPHQWRLARGGSAGGIYQLSLTP